MLFDLDSSDDEVPQEEELGVRIASTMQQHTTPEKANDEEARRAKRHRRAFRIRPGELGGEEDLSVDLDDEDAVSTFSTMGALAPGHRVRPGELGYESDLSGAIRPLCHTGSRESDACARNALHSALACVNASAAARAASSSAAAYFALLVAASS